VSIFVTGGTGFLGSYVLTELLRKPEQQVIVFTRATDRRGAIEKLWKNLQLHMPPTEFHSVLPRVDFALGDLHADGLGLSDTDHGRIRREADSVLHIAASLNRKSNKACLNTNLRGTLSVVKLARELADAGQLKRFSHVSTVAVCGQRSHEVVEEDESVDWNRSDYDPYGRTKKYCEHMVRQLLPDVPITIFRPSIVMGDSRFPETTQFDMVRAFCFLADMRIVPMDPSTRLDIIPADYVGKAIATLHLKERPRHEIYHLSAGRNAKTASEVAEAMRSHAPYRMRFAPRASYPFQRTVSVLNRLPRKNPVYIAAALMKVFWPYITFDTVFANERVVNEMGYAPTPFTDYCGPLYRWSKKNRFKYPALPLPALEEAA
jgi:thioester reductase-like protein